MRLARRTLLAAAATPSFARAPAVVGSNAPPNTPWERQWKRFAENAAQAGVPVEMMVGGELGGDEGILAALRRNRVQVGGFTLAAMANVVPEFALLTIPYFFASAEEAAYVQDTTALTVFEPLLREKGLAFLQWTNSGWAGLFSTSPIRDPAQLKGHKYRAAPAIAHRVFLEAVGADVVPIGLADLIPALQTGMVEGGVITLSYYGPTFADTAPYFTNTRHYPEAGLVAANADWFSSLTPTEQAAMRNAFGDIAVVRVEIADTEREMTASLRQRGVTILDLSDDERARWADATSSIAERLVREIGGQASAVLAGMTAARDAFRRLNR